MAEDMSYKNSKAAKPPKGLSLEARRLWKRLVDEYGIQDAGGLTVLATGLEAFDRMRQAQAAIRADGPTVTDRFGQTKAHPLLTTERDSRSQFLSAMRMLNLDLEVT